MALLRLTCNICRVDCRIIHMLPPQAHTQAPMDKEKADLQWSEAFGRRGSLKVMANVIGPLADDAARVG